MFKLATCDHTKSAVVIFVYLMPKRHTARLERVDVSSAVVTTDAKPVFIFLLKPNWPILYWISFILTVFLGVLKT